MRVNTGYYFPLTYRDAASPEDALTMTSIRDGSVREHFQSSDLGHIVMSCIAVFSFFRGASSSFIGRGTAMDICCLQHVPYEGPGNIEAWALAHGHDFRITRLYRDEPLPDQQELDLLVVMGGPMSVHDEAAYPWLLREKKLID